MEITIHSGPFCRPYEYRCAACGQLRLALVELTKCGHCGSPRITKTELERLAKFDGADRTKVYGEA